MVFFSPPHRSDCAAEGVAAEHEALLPPAGLRVQVHDRDGPRALQEAPVHVGNVCAPRPALLPGQVRQLRRSLPQRALEYVHVGDEVAEDFCADERYKKGSGALCEEVAVRHRCERKLHFLEDDEAGRELRLRGRRRRKGAQRGRGGVFFSPAAASPDQWCGVACSLEADK